MTSRSKSKQEHMIWYIGTHEWFCLHCGYRFDFSSMLPASIDTVVEFHKAFQRSHKKCSPSKAGAGLKEWMERHWEKVNPAAAKQS